MLFEDLEQFSQSLKVQTDSIASVLDNHLWVTSDFVEQAQLSMEKTRMTAQSLKQRVKAIISGFEQLPVIEDSVYSESSVTDASLF